MGEIVASMELENAGDREIVRQGLRDESTVRRATVEGVVDTGAVMLVLPEDVVGRLGLATQREVVVTYANEYRETRQVAGPVTVHIGNRFMIAECVIGPPSSEPLIGRPDRAGSAGLGGGLRQSHAGAAPGVAGQPPAEAEVTRAAGASHA